MMMEKFTPFEKLSKKKQRELNAQKRGDWGAVNPVTRVPPTPKAYDRNKEKAARQKDEGSLLDNLKFLLRIPESGGII